MWYLFIVIHFISCDTFCHNFYSLIFDDRIPFDPFSHFLMEIDVQIEDPRAKVMKSWRPEVTPDLPSNSVAKENNSQTKFWFKIEEENS